MLDDLLNQPISEGEVTRRTLVDMRRRIANNEAIPEEELNDALMRIRKAYGSEAKAKAKATKAPKASKAKKPTADADKLLGDLLGGL